MLSGLVLHCRDLNTTLHKLEHKLLAAWLVQSLSVVILLIEITRNVLSAQLSGAWKFTGTTFKPQSWDGNRCPHSHPPTKTCKCERDQQLNSWHQLMAKCGMRMFFSKHCGMLTRVAPVISTAVLPTPEP